MPATEGSIFRLRKHADYQRVYKQTRKQFSQQMSYFYALRPIAPLASLAFQGTGPRVGLTVGKVLGKAVDRNRIKRRMREAVRKHIGTLVSPVDVVLHPRKTVLEIEFLKLEHEVGRIFSIIQAAIDQPAASKAPANPAPARKSAPGRPHANNQARVAIPAKPPVPRAAHAAAADRESASIAPLHALGSRKRNAR